MASNQDIQAYFDQLELSYEQVGEGMWVLNLEDQGVDNLVINHEEPVLLFRIKLREAPKKNREIFLTQLLVMNATDLVHGAYALEGDSVILVDTLQSENLDLNELEASIDSLALAAVQSYTELASY